MHPKDADVMANSIDPDQTASSWSALFAETYLSQYIEFVGMSLAPTTTEKLCCQQGMDGSSQRLVE